MPPPDGTATPLVVLNPHASRLHDSATRRALTSALVKAVRIRTGQEPVVAVGTMEAARAAFAEAAETRPALVVVAGGDGSVRQAASALAGTGIPLAIVPCGTGNVLGQALRIGGPAAVTRALPTAVERTVDLGRVTWGAEGDLEPAGDELFVVACGIGLDARIMAATDVGLKRRFSFGAYVVAAAGQLIRPRPARYTIEADGEAIETTGLMVLVANAGEIIPGLLGPRRPIDPGDGRLEVLVLGGSGDLRGHAKRSRVVASAGRAPRGCGPASVGQARAGHRHARPAAADRWRRPRHRLARGGGPAGGSQPPRSGPRRALILGSPVGALGFGRPATLPARWTTNRPRT